MRVSGLILAACLLITAVSPQSAQGFGKLAKASAAVDESDGYSPPKKERPSKPRKKREADVHFHYSHSSDDCEDTSFEGAVSAAFAQLFIIGATSPWWGPNTALADDSAEQASFQTPYYDDYHGLLDIEPFCTEDGRHTQVEFLADYGTDFSGLQRYGGQFQLDSVSRWGIDSEFDNFIEDLPNGDDQLWMGDANVTYRFAQNESMTFHTGLGFNWMSDAGQNDFGWNFTYGFDLFPRKPWVIRGVMDLGRLGDTSRVHVRTDVGVVWKNAEFFVGYDLERISTVNLQGMTAGVQFRF